MNHKNSTYLLIGIVFLMVTVYLISALSSDDIDTICNIDNNILYRYNGEWICGALNDTVINQTVNNITNIYNNLSEFSNYCYDILPNNDINLSNYDLTTTGVLTAGSGSLVKGTGAFQTFDVWRTDGARTRLGSGATFSVLDYKTGQSLVVRSNNFAGSSTGKLTIADTLATFTTNVELGTKTLYAYSIDTDYHAYVDGTLYAGNVDTTTITADKSYITTADPDLMVLSPINLQKASNLLAYVPIEKRGISLFTDGNKLFAIKENDYYEIPINLIGELPEPNIPIPETKIEYYFDKTDNQIKSMSKPVKSMPYAIEEGKILNKTTGIIEDKPIIENEHNFCSWCEKGVF